MTGGPEVAAAMLGWENAFHCEINPFGRAVLNYWFPKSRSYEDITKTDFREWRGKIDVLTGGFPCQPFSYAGKRRGGEDERYLWPQMLRAIDEIRPTWVVGENVAALTTMVEGGVLTELGCDTSLFGEVDGVHRYGLRQSFTIERICKDLERLGYSVQPLLIPAAAVGAPHRRDRVFILANVENPIGDGPGIGRNAEQRDKWNIRNPCTRGNGRVCDKKGIKADRNGKIWSLIASRLRPGRRWKLFPTVSPVHRGNDGIPIRLDNLSIPFAKWRTESLKAYGNAIVPQVMYEIFIAIEQAEQ